MRTAELGEPLQEPRRLRIARPAPGQEDDPPAGPDRLLAASIASAEGTTAGRSRTSSAIAVSGSPPLGSASTPKGMTSATGERE